MIITDFEKCTGCGACVQKCPQKCISWIDGEFGFRYPRADESECIACGMCDSVCPIHKNLPKCEDQIVYALVHKEPSVLMSSTSGGAFSVLAETILNDGGVVYGCAMTHDFQARHIRIDSRSDLAKLRGSKYVQSDTDHIFVQIQDDLKNERTVFFTGTPCQVAGLNGFLGREYDRLLTADIICHGVGSQKYFDQYVAWLKTQKPGLQRIEFRNKKFVGWSSGGLVTADGKDMPLYNHEHYYYSYFLSYEMNRKSCYSCSYADRNRVGDITLGDFWGAEQLDLGLDVSHGCSLVIANTGKGKERIENLRTSAEIRKADLEDAVKYNKQLSSPSEVPNSRSERLREYETLNGEEIQKRYKKSHPIRILKGTLKVLLPYDLKTWLRNRF